jgi:hypothetical protein
MKLTFPHAPLAALVLSLTIPSLASAQESGCTVAGDAVMRATAKLYREASGGSPFGRFTGGMVTLQASDFPTSRSGRARVSLSGFGLTGFVDVTDLPVFTTRDVPVVQGHVWIAAHRDVVVIGSAPGKLQVEKQVHFPMGQKFVAWAPCEALSFTQRVATGWTPPGDARGYVAKDTVEVLGSPDGASVTSLYPSSEASGVLLWSTQRQGAWVHVEFHGDVVIDGWVRSQNVRMLPRGETMDQLYPPSVRRGKPTLKLATEPRVVSKDAPLTVRAGASETAPAIGTVAPNTELYLLDIVAGWASVVPKTLSVAPEGESQFWVRAADLGL